MPPLPEIGETVTAAPVGNGANKRRYLLMFHVFAKDEER